ncbi:MAG TPA: cytochrome c1 [Methylophilaceae bacterium]|nr:cytochrome c1 [Methylophilaceae bacterium]
MKKFLLLLVFLPVMAFASEETVHLDHAPIDPDNQASLQRGARTFVNYCLSCHSAAYMRYNRLRDIGLSEAQIKDNLLFAGEKVGETMKVAMPRVNAKAWFGAAPPDLSVEARARTADWLYSYLRGFYRDDTRPTGWNNVVFDKVAMPHVLWQLQGQQILKTEELTDADGHVTHMHKLVLDKPGLMSTAEYDQTIADLVNYLVYMSEPGKPLRMELGLVVLLFLSLLFVVAFYLKKEFWKDIH